MLKLSCIPRAVAWMWLVPAFCAWGQGTSEEEELAAVFGDKASVSIATGRPQPLRRAPAVATVITAQDIAAMGAVDLDEVLEAVPGVHVSRNNQGYNPLYVIRGVYSEFNPQTLVLQNGVPMTTLFVGNRGNIWAGLPLENVARIEIIRGPGSALYGADAYSGVINIITKTAADVSGTEFGVRAGSFNSRDGWVLHGGKLGPVDLAAYLRVGRSDGFKEPVTQDYQSILDSVFPAPPASLAPGPVNTGYEAVDASLDLGYDKLRLRANYRLRDNVGTGAGAASALDPVGKGQAERLTLDLGWNDIEMGKDWRLGLNGSYARFISKFPEPLQLFPPGAFFGMFPNGMLGAPNTWERQIRLSAVATYTGFASHSLRLGVGHDDLNLYKTQEFKNFSTPGGLPVPTPGAAVVEFPVADSFLEPQRRKVSYLYLQDEWSLGKDLTLTAGLRRDHYSDFGGTTNPRLALVWDANLNLTAKLLYGRAFRAPAFTEQHSINNPVTRGNENLQPETINTLEAAFAWQARANMQLNLSLFRYQMNDIIRAVNSGGGTKTFNNVGSQRGHGLELESIWNVGRNVRMAAHYAYQRSIDETTGEDAGYAPHHHFFARADWAFSDGWSLSGQANRVAGRQRAAGDTRPNIADYSTVDVSLRTNRGKNRWDFVASVRNLFNADVREPSLYTPGDAIPVLIPNDLPMARRSLYLQGSYRF